MKISKYELTTLILLLSYGVIGIIGIYKNVEKDKEMERVRNLVEISLEKSNMASTNQLKQYYLEETIYWRGYEDALKKCKR